MGKNCKPSITQPSKQTNQGGKVSISQGSSGPRRLLVLQSKHQAFVEDNEQETQNTMHGLQFKTSAYHPNSERRYWQHHAAETLLFPSRGTYPNAFFQVFIHKLFKTVFLLKQCFVLTGHANLAVSSPAASEIKNQFLFGLAPASLMVYSTTAPQVSGPAAVRGTEINEEAQGQKKNFLFLDQ